MRRMLQYLAFLSCAGLVLFPVGCNFGPGRIPETGATLEGTVKYGDEPVLVAMVGAAGSNSGAQGYIEDDGRYRIQNVPLGEVTLSVDVDAAKGELTGKIMAKQKVPKVVNVPAKYADPRTSGIKTTINPGENHYDIVIPK
jgi:hypothetical protein